MKNFNVRQLFIKFDWLLLGATLLLFCLGLAAIYSVSLSQDNTDFANFKKQIVFGAVGIIALFLISVINYSAFRVYSRLIYWVAALLLILVLFFGSTIRGTTGWFAIAGYGFQPVELAKIALIVFLSRFFANRFSQFNLPKHLIVSFAGAAVLIALVILQPDFGSAAVLMGIYLMMLIFTKVKAKVIIAILLILSVLLTVGWFFGLKDYQKERVMVLLNPERDPLGSGYNVTQALIAIGSGQFFGRGLGFGSQSQLKFIPESQTDFVFAVIAEELGFLGVALLMVLWGIIFYRLIRAAKTAHDDFGMFMILGITFVFFIHLVINIGMNLGLVPVTGISLPFLSSGGSFLITSFILIGMAESVIVRK
jgi:rod shape determining protein RodA